MTTNFIIITSLVLGATALTAISTPVYAQAQRAKYIECSAEARLIGNFAKTAVENGLGFTRSQYERYMEMSLDYLQYGIDDGILFPSEREAVVSDVMFDYSNMLEAMRPVLESRPLVDVVVALAGAHNQNCLNIVSRTN